MKVRMIRRLMGAVLLLGALLPTTAFGAVVEMRLLYDGAMHDYRAEEVQIEVNGEALTGLDMPPVILNDRTLVPVRAIFEKLGAEVVWNADAQEVYISYDNQLEVLRIDDNTGLIDGLEFSMDVPPKIINERTMIPARAALEAVGCTVGWQADTRTVTVDDQAHASQPEEPTAPSTSTPNTNDTTQSTSGSTTDDTPAPTGTVTASSPITVQSVTVPASAQSRQSFSVNCSGVIEKYNCFLLGDDRIVVDIYNANNGISNATITGTNSTIVSSIRSAQNQTQPERVARVVFDITAGTGYSATLSNDRRSFQISFDANHITNLTMQSQAGADVITITGEQAPAASFQLLGSPDRLVIDIPNATNSLRSSYEGGLNYVQDARVSMYNTTTTRVVLDLESGASYARNVTVEAGSREIRILLTPTESNPIVPSTPLDPNKYTIAVDAGHGGSSPGAVYPDASGNDVLEKDLTRSITDKLEAILVAEGYNVVSTRPEDSTVDLYTRAEIANAANADLFVSIHINASGTVPTFQGIYTYHHPSSNRSKLFAQAVQDAVCAATGGIDRGISSANYAVLRETNMAAVLVECGFMSNIEELTRLQDDAYQQKLAEGIAQGIADYLAARDSSE